MNKIAAFTLGAGMLAAQLCHAAAVEFDTPAAHVIVVRSIDTWSPDKGTSADSLATFKSHKFAFEVDTPTRVLRGYPTVFQKPMDAPIVHRVEALLAAQHIELANTTNFNLRVFKPTTIAPSEYAALAASQASMYERGVYAQGNPSELAGKVSARKFFGSVLAVATVGVAGDKFGAPAAGVVMGSGVAGDAYSLGAGSRAALLPLVLPPLQADAYASVDVRRVVQGVTDRIGQVVIAYKAEKTPEAEEEALAAAIASLAGADTTADAIEQARGADLAERQRLWDACVQAEKCGK